MRTKKPHGETSPQPEASEETFYLLFHHRIENGDLAYAAH